MTLINTGKPILQRHGKQFMLADTLLYKDVEGTIWMIPTGFVTDLASIPSWIFWWQFHCVNFAAILHDYGYENHELWKIVNGEPEVVRVTRDFCDRLFYRMLIGLGVSQIESTLMYWAVHLFGRFLWEN